MKKLIFVILCFCILLLAMPVNAASIGFGDYVYFGKYCGAPVLWRCAGVDDNGALLVSERIISIKSFDAAEGDMPFGSGRWSSSSIRKWLNSASSAVDYSSGAVPENGNLLMEKNGYESESGFLSETNFSSAELSLINTVSRKTFLSKLYLSEAEGGSEPYSLPNGFGKVGSNKDNAYWEATDDKVFLLSSVEAAEIAQNFGKTFYFAYPTAEAAEQSAYKSDNLSNEKYWSWWLRDCLAADSGSRAVCVFPVNKLSLRGWISGEYAYNDGIGVRPALYLNNEAVSLSGGNGSEKLPYLAGVFTAVNCETSVKTGNAGEYVRLDITSSYAPQNSSTGIILNGELVKSFNSGNSFKLERGENTVSAVLLQNGEIIAQSEEISVFGTDTYIADNMASFSFDDWQSSEFLVADGSLTETDNGSLSSSSGFSLYFPSISEIKDGILEISYDITCASDKYANVLLGGEALSLCFGGEWISPVSFTSGYIYCGGAKAFENRLANGEKSTLTVRCDFNQRIAEVALNGVYSSVTSQLPDAENAPVSSMRMSVEKPNCTVTIGNFSAKLKKEKFIASADISAVRKNGGLEAKIDISKYAGSGALTLVSVVYENGTVADVRLADISLLNSETERTVTVRHPISPADGFTLKAFLTYSGDLLNHISYLE